MPPKQRITREMIMERAFDMFCREGMDAVNARSVAKALNCSTQPIFSYYAGMSCATCWTKRRRRCSTIRC